MGVSHRRCLGRRNRASSREKDFFQMWQQQVEVALLNPIH